MEIKLRSLLSQSREVIERFSRDRAKSVYLGDHAALCRVLGSFSLFVDTRDESLSPHLLLDGFWESWITQALTSIPEGTVCADVGANVGYYSLVLAELTGTKVYAFEPERRILDLLRKSVRISGLPIQVVGSAAGAREGTVFLQRDGWFLGNTRVREAGDDAAKVSVVSLDDAIRDPLGFVKIDAEGYEPQVWAGMKRHLESRPTILMEFSPALYEDASGFLAEIAAHYPIRMVDDQGNIVPVSTEDLMFKHFTMLWLEREK